MSLRNAIFVSLFCLGWLATGPRASADPITLYTSGYPNYLSASATDASNQESTTSNYVNSLPFTSMTNDTNGSSTSSVTGNLTTSSLNYSFTQSLTDANSFAISDNVIYFTAGANTTYSISGSLTATGGFTSEHLYAILSNVTTGTDIYRYTTVSSASSQTFDSSGGPLTGLLTTGDLYYFRASDSLYGANGANAGLTGNTVITFTQPGAVPEPASLFLLGIGSSLSLYFRSKRRRSPV